MRARRALSTAALIADGRGRYLVARRPAGGQGGLKWEFPGGKVEDGETPQAGLRRELLEELGSDFRVLDEVFSTEFEHNGTSFLLKVFEVEPAAAPPAALEHERLAWLAPAGIAELELVDSDRRIVEYLLAK